MATQTIPHFTGCSKYILLTIKELDDISEVHIVIKDYVSVVFD